MLTDADIYDLIRLPKTITEKSPSLGYREENGHKRCDLKLRGISDGDVIFEAFIRQSERFIENYSIGLRCYMNDGAASRITLVRYNGSHGETSRDVDGHYAKPHIHRITAEEIALGSIQPQERQREITDRYVTYEEALTVFFADTETSNAEDYFSDLAQGRLF